MGSLRARRALASAVSWLAWLCLCVAVSLPLAVALGSLSGSALTGGTSPDGGGWAVSDIHYTMDGDAAVVGVSFKLTGANPISVEVRLNDTTSPWYPCGSGGADAWTCDTTVGGTTTARDVTQLVVRVAELPTNAPPKVEWAWELPDMQPGAAGIQYGTTADPHQHDHDMLVGPSSPPADHHMMQVVPNLDDQPEARRIEYWLAAEDPDGVDDIKTASVRVYRPDGSLLYELPMTKAACADLGSATTVGTPLEAAVHSGQMPAAEAGSIVDKCGSGGKALYRAVGELGRKEPPGEYKVVASVADESGATDAIVNYFDVLAVLGLQVDFDGVDFGSVTPNQPAWVTGDTAWNPPSDSHPTVRNVGNTDLHLNATFSAMAGASHGGKIASFGAQLDAEKADPVAPATDVCFSHALGPTALARLDLGVHPGSIAADTYQGTLTLAASASCP